jgi:hypothetical protein
VAVVVTQLQVQLAAQHHLDKVQTVVMEFITHRVTTQVVVVVVKLPLAQQRLRQVQEMAVVEPLTLQLGARQLLLVKMSAALIITQVVVVDQHKKLQAQI